ncbi:hypothetical protein PPERSA_10134 [Pseudocohnilembus persalinus]|uniref:Tubulin-tyrosine ligase family protein n=1 Tax=Pseudocohnilembus persalinus TaxID=266149 RepID=A0A0V0R0M3_PSEPJ|nr:hypothetical protein PPERSA_10134 [Pseudocohnilembus persalinus]|eukprot:KRX07850.1 hypothetical protein PPERSA_10134 [Pseudocohnilembus persalinus]
MQTQILDSTKNKPQKQLPSFLQKKINQQQKKDCPQISQQQKVKQIEKFFKYKQSALLNALDNPHELVKVLQEKAKELNIYADMEEEDDENEEDIQYHKQDKNHVMTLQQQYRKKYNIDKNKKIFFLKGGYPAMVESLLKTGNWVQMKDQSQQLAADLVFCCKKKDIDFENLGSNTICNKFKKCTALTSKHGLARNLTNLIHLENKDPHKFYPRCFDIIDSVELEDFIEEFKFSKAESLVLCTIFTEVKSMQFTKKIEQIINKNDYPIITPQEWQFINQSPENFSSNFTESEQKNLLLLKNRLNNSENQKYKQIYQTQNIKELVYQIIQVLKQMQNFDPQFSMNGDQNIWIVKPAGMSRGRGIKSFNDLEQLLFYVMGKQAQWVAQKYIENPLTLKKKKFDIRQWVVVTSWDPLQVWFYDDCYIRICSQEYNKDSFQNPFAHLTNNCIQQKQEDYGQNSEEMMMNLPEFTQYMKDQYKQDIFNEKIKPQLLEHSISVMKSVSDSIQNRQNSFEFYGFDYMMDESFNVWLIEVNSSPTMEYRYKGYIPGVKSENLFGKTYGKISTLSRDRAHHRGADLPTELRYTSTVYGEYQKEANLSTTHITEFNPLKRFGQGESKGVSDVDRERANYGLTMPEKKFEIKQETELSYEEALRQAHNAQQ